MVIIDNSTLSSLTFIKQLAILDFFFKEITIPNAVYLEYKSKWSMPLLNNYKIISIEPLELSEFVEQIKSISLV